MLKFSACSENCKKACWNFSMFWKLKKHVENFRIQVLKWSVPDAHPDSRVLSILKFSGIFENCMRGIFYSLKDTLLFKCSEFSEEVYTRCTSRWLSLQYSGIEIRQFTHSPEIKREIPFCTRKRSETYFMNILRCFDDHQIWPQNWPHHIWASLCQVLFFVNLLHRPGVWHFDIWQIISLMSDLMSDLVSDQIFNFLKFYKFFKILLLTYFNHFLW